MNEDETIMARYYKFQRDGIKIGLLAGLHFPLLLVSFRKRMCDASIKGKGGWLFAFKRTVSVLNSRNVCTEMHCYISVESS